MARKAPTARKKVAKRLKPIPVIFDTSVLRTIHFASTPEFLLLKDLAAAGVIDLLVPKMVAIEWRSQQIHDTNAALRDARKAVNELHKFQAVSGIESVRSLLEAVSKDAIRAVADQSALTVRGVLKAAGFVVIKFHADDVGEVMDGYGDGKPPFGEVRARKDLPDAFIFSAVQRAVQADARTVFVCGDEATSTRASAARA